MCHHAHTSDSCSEEMILQRSSKQFKAYNYWYVLHNVCNCLVSGSGETCSLKLSLSCPGVPRIPSTPCLGSRAKPTRLSSHSKSLWKPFLLAVSRCNGMQYPFKSCCGMSLQPFHNGSSLALPGEKEEGLAAWRVDFLLWQDIVA